uniref:Uncharacterized protein n=1 Tax=Glossina austeni TaxID=7395 RepID=A0A1A9UHZ9_GLOAU
MACFYLKAVGVLKDNLRRIYPKTLVTQLMFSQYLFFLETFLIPIILFYWGREPRPKPPRNSTSPAPGPTSPFLSVPPGAPSPERVVAAGRGRTVSGLVGRLRVAGTISGDTGGFITEE